MFKTYCTILMVCLAAVASAQYQYELYDWEAEPQIHRIDSADLNELSVGIKDYRMVEYYLDAFFSRIMQYYTIHSIVHINSADEIDEYNKVYIPTIGTAELVAAKARIITNDGRVLNFDDSQIQTATMEGYSFKYFAIEGLEVGCEVEFMYTLKKPGDFKGDTEVMQNNRVSTNVEFHIVSQPEFVFEGKSYNGFPAMVEGDTVSGKNHIMAYADRVPALRSESYCAYEANKMRVDYKLKGVEGVTDDNAVSYEDAKLDVLSMLFEDISKAVSKEIKSNLKTWGVKGGEPQERIRLIEAGLKENFNLVQQRGDELVALESIHKNKYCSEVGMIKLFCVYLSEAGINHQVVLTCDRLDRKFDPDFESYVGLHEYLIYFPEENLYIAPAYLFTRMDYIPPELAGNNGLFIDYGSWGNIVGSWHKVKEIPALHHTRNNDNMNIGVELDLEDVALNIDMERSFEGYSAFAVGPGLLFMPVEEREEVLKELLNLGIEGSTVSEATVENLDLALLHAKPLTFKGDVVAPGLLQKAGRKYLVKIGETIGPQVEMYQPDERQMDVENEYNRSYNRTIMLQIPEGYTITNPEALNIDIYHQDGGERTCTFTSSYTLEGNILTATVVEYYNRLHYPKSDFEAFQKVINAAADFNKVVLFLEAK